MRYIPLIGLSAALFYTGCQYDRISDNGNADGFAVQPQAEQWEDLPEGKTFLLTKVDSSGVPEYTPVEFVKDMAVIEGDIVIAQGEEQLQALRAELVDPREEKGRPLGKSSGFIRNSTYTGGANAWPGGAIPYIIHSSVNKQAIESAVFDFNQAGGISYVPWTSKYTSCVLFIAIAGTTSYSSVGMVSPTSCQTIQLGSQSRSVLLHEMGHAAGMYHEHTRPDRDNYVTLTTTGRDDSGWYNRDYAKLTDGTTVGEYDYASIMHYQTTTRVFTYANGTTYTVKLAAKDGRNIANTALSATDRVSLWGIAVNQYPLLTMAVKTGLTNKLTKLFMTTYNNVTRKWICIYDPATGNANITAVNADNTYGASVQNLNVGTGYTLISPYLSGIGTPCIMFYSSTTGRVKLYNVNPVSGMMHTLIASSVWNSGWTTIEFYQSVNNKFWFFQNASNWNVHIWGITAEGGLGSSTLQTNWPTWNYSKPFYIEASAGVISTYFVFRTTGGLTRIRAMPSTGVLGNIVQDIQLPAIPAVGLWQSTTRAYLALAPVNALYVVDMDHTGFRNTGSSLYRVAVLGYNMKRIDAAADIYSANASNNFINNRYFDFKHVLTYQRQDVPDYTFIGTGAPFH